MNHHFIKSIHRLIISAFAIFILLVSGSSAIAGSIEGYVYDGGYYGYSNIIVYCASNAYGGYTFTDNFGYYRFDDLPADEYYIYIWYDDQNIQGELYYTLPAGKQPGIYFPTYSTFCWENATPINIQSEFQTVSNIDIILNMSGYLSGHVYRSPENTPISGVEVWAWSDTICYGNWDITDNTGAFEIPNLYHVNKDEEQTVGYTLYTAKDNFITTYTPNLGTSYSLIELSMKSSGTLVVFVYEGNFTPVKNATVTLWSVKAGFMGIKGDGSTNDGYYRFYNCPPYNDYVFAVSSPNYPVREYKFDWISYNEPIWINLGDGSESLSGTITPPESGIAVYLWSASTGVNTMTYTTAGGQYQFTGLFKGNDYTITVLHPYYPPYYVSNISVPGVKNIDVTNACEGPYRITGTVTGYGYPNVLVEITSTLGWWSSTTTNENGTYEIKCLTPGTYTISIKDYFNPMWKTVTIVNQDVQVNFTAGVQPTYSIGGTIYNLAKDDIAWISVWSVSTWAYGLSEVEGTGSPVTYRIDNLYPLSDYVVEIYTSEYYEVYHERSGWEYADWVNISNGNQLNIDFTLPQYAQRSTISGTITFPAGATIGDSVWVSAYATSVWGWNQTEVVLNQNATTNVNVSYSISGLIPAKDYVVSVWSDKYKNRYYDGIHSAGTPNWDEAKNIDTTDAQPDTAINFWLTPGESIKGQVVGKGNAYIHVEAWSSSTGGWGDGLTDASGNYTISGLEPATDYIVAAWDQIAGYVYYKTNDISVWDFSQASYVSSGATNIRLNLIEGGTISGYVYSSAGQPLKDIWVSATSDTTFAGNGAYTNDKGKYEIAGLPTGTEYVVLAEPQWYMPYLSQKRTGISCPSTVDFYLPLKGTVYTISGKVTDATGKGVKDVDIEIWSFGSGYGKSKTNKDGIFSISGLMGGIDYFIEATPPENSGLAYASKSVQVPNDNYDFQLKSAKSFSGTVTDKSGSKVKDVQITVYSSSKGFWKQALTNSNGFYQITGVPDAADYLITAEKTGYVNQEKSDNIPGTVDFILEFAGNISGTIVDKNTMEPIRNATVEVKTPTSPNIIAVATTNEKGKYELRNLPEFNAQGIPITDYAITASHGLYPSKTKSPHRVGDTVDFQLEKGSFSEINGTVKSYTGSVVSNATVVVEVFTKVGTSQKFEKSVVASNTGNFVIPGLNPNTSYYLKIQAWTGDVNNQRLSLDQWIGPDLIGIDNTGVISSTAREFKTSTGKKLDLKFSKNITRNLEIVELSDVPGPVQNLRSTTHTSVLIAPPTLSRAVTNVNSRALGTVSNNPYVTVTWEPTQPDADEGYYTLFNQEFPYQITKRNAPSDTPQRTRTATSGPLTGDDVQYYFHIAAVDNRGTIGETASIGFRIDTVAPKNAIVRAKANDTTATTKILTLELGATGAYEVYISSTSYGENGKWEDFSTSKQWKVADTEETQKVYVQYRDLAGNVSNAVTTVNLKSLLEKDTLENAIRALKIVCGIPMLESYGGTDVFDDKKINLHEVIYILQKIARLRN